MYQLYLIENRTPPNCSDLAAFWRKDGEGYTFDLYEAEQFDETEAEKIITSAKGSHLFVKHKVSEVLAHSFCAVNASSLR